MTTTVVFPEMIPYHQEILASIPRPLLVAWESIKLENGNVKAEYYDKNKLPVPLQYNVSNQKYSIFGADKEYNAQEIAKELSRMLTGGKHRIVKRSRKRTRKTRRPKRRTVRKTTKKKRSTRRKKRSVAKRSVCRSRNGRKSRKR